jgi:hypothetical protein
MLALNADSCVQACRGLVMVRWLPRVLLPALMMMSRWAV